MAGKSTYLRQVALIIILAQMGAFVPCAEARIGIVDRIFTRIGAGDNLAGGESTFMVEMHETSHILNQFTSRSLVILDEVGRGTSTYDGISIAWAAVEYLSRKKNGAVGPKVLFATHYFELTDLEGKLPGVKNANVAVKEWQGDVIFLHKIVPGAADRSYGIHVAQLAGLPKEVVLRAHEVLSALERKPPPSQAPVEQPDLFSFPSNEILIELGKLDLNSITPLEALQLMAQWKNKYT
jgi:DNA mismatch repair protein MutS